MNDSAVSQMRFYTKSIQIPLGIKTGIETASLQTKCAWISIAPSMSDTYTMRKFGGDKIALLGLFAVALLTARFVVGLRSALVLSEPIRLPRAGLSASVPTGNGWQSRQRWDHEGNTFVLSSGFSPGSGEATAWVICRYQAAVKTTSSQMRFEQKARKFDGGIVEINQMVTDSLIFDWARVKGLETPLTMYLATAILSDDWQLDIEVYEITGDAEQAEQTFKSVVESVSLR